MRNEKEKIGIRIAECGMKGQRLELGSRTRRRPIGRDYAAAKDAECGMKGQRLELGSRNAEN
jgi:hypothetical protein